MKPGLLLFSINHRMKKILIICLAPAVVIAAMAFIKPVAKPAKRYLVTTYGAKGDSATLNTQAIQKTIDECSAKGGGVVVIPKGIFRSGAIFLKKDVDLYVEKDGVLKGSADQQDYPQIATRWEGEERQWTSAFVNIIDQEGTHISGEGTIDGSGDIWESRSPRRMGGVAGGSNGNATPVVNRPAGPRLGRPRLICFQNCKHVVIENLHLHNQAVWCLHILYSTDVTARNLNITANHNIPSSDGIDVDSSNGTHITKCFIDVNDDCISIKSGKDDDGRRVNRPCENVLIDDCHFAYGHGGVAMGSEVTGGIKNVMINNCVMDGSNWAPIRFKSQPSRGGVVENITYQNIELKDTKKAFEFNMAWRLVGTVREQAKVPTIVRNILIKNVSGTVAAVGDMSGLDNSPIEGVKFVDCHIKAQTGLILHNVTKLDTAGLNISVVSGPKVIMK